MFLDDYSANAVQGEGLASETGSKYLRLEPDWPGDRCGEARQGYCVGTP